MNVAICTTLIPCCVIQRGVEYLRENATVGKTLLWAYSYRWVRYERKQQQTAAPAVPAAQVRIRQFSRGPWGTTCIVIQNTEGNVKYRKHAIQIISKKWMIRATKIFCYQCTNLMTKILQLLINTVIQLKCVSDFICIL